jgi:ABC-2 type transport system permease protein
MYGQQSQPVSAWTMMREQLAQNYTVTQVDLSTGRVPGDVDVLLIIAPQRFTDRERFAVDQYLMRGGAVIVALSNYMLAPQQLGGGIMMAPLQEGLAEMLDYYGVKVEPGMVMDPQNEPFPMQVPRKVGNITVTELRQINYPFFVDVRDDGMNKESPIVAGLSAVTLHWASPLSVDATKNEGRKVTELLHSTKASWIRETATVDPDLEQYPQQGFPVEGGQASRLLGVSIRGVFTSYFKDKASPFEAKTSAEPTPTPDPNAIPTPKAPVMGTVQTSPDTARLVVIGSAEFVDDTVMQISQSASAERYLNNLQLLQNTVDWSVEDEDLLTIRSRGSYARLLNPLSTAQQSFWEGLNYVLALAGLIVIGFVWSSRRRHETPMSLVDAKKESSKGSDKR